MHRIPLCLVLSLVLMAPLFGDEPPPEVKAQISLYTTTLRTSKSAAERRKAAEALGALGASGMTARRDLCQAMMDGAQTVRTAAADALKSIDEPMYKLATAIYINSDLEAISAARQQGLKAEPLTPLVLRVGVNSVSMIQAALGRKQGLGSEIIYYKECCSTLAEIAQSDPAANRFVITALTFQLPGSYSSRAEGVRSVAISSIAKMANVKQSVIPLLTIASSDATANRIAAIQLLTEIADHDTKASIKKVFESHRFDKNPAVRAAIDAALKALEAGN